MVLNKNKYDQNGFSLIEVLIVLFIIAILGTVGWWVWHRSHKVVNISTPTNKVLNNKGPSVSVSQTAENWTTSNKMVLANTTSTDTHKLSDGTYRMYYMHDGNIVYSDSTDAVNFSAPNPTGVNGGPGAMLSNPSVLEIKTGDWIMIYEQDFGTNPQTAQRNLYLATSSDGMHFTEAGIAVDSSKQDNNFASVPNLILLPNGTVRMYYVCGGQDICARDSSDNGKTWIKDTFKFNQTNVGDPDVLRSGNNWVMYFTNLNPDSNGIYKAYSSDGLNWTALNGPVIEKTNSNYVNVDPDVVETSSNHFTMFYGQASDPSSPLNLYSASYRGNIFQN